MSIANQYNKLIEKKIDKCRLVLDDESSESIVEALGGPNGIMAPLIEDRGVVFPYSPSISYSLTSSYTPVEMVHTNYEISSFQKSAVASLNIQQCRFTAETQEKADYMLAAITFFRTFSKMNYGINDPLKGTPPRILRFYAYGDYMFQNVPVAIKSFTMPMDNDVDYVQTSHNTQVPVIATFSLDLNFMPTPSKMKNEFSLNRFASGNLIKKGYI